MEEPIGIVLPPATLTAAEEGRLARAIEAGVLAAEARRTGLIGGVPVPAGEAELIMLERLGERAARRFVEANLRLVAMVSRKEAVRSGMGEGDLFQEGCLGLIEAVRRFDHRRELRFATYALYWVRAYIGALTANRAGELNVPASRAEKARKLRGTQARLSQQLGRTASATDLAAVVGRPSDWVARMLGHRHTQVLSDDEFAELDIVDESVGHDFEAVLSVSLPGREVLACLSGIQRRVIELRYGFADGTEHTYSDTSRRLGMPISTVRRHEARALEQLRGVYPEQARVHLAG